jgi:hypothetical protein
VVSVLAIRHKFRGDRFLWAIKIRSTAFVGGEVKPSAPRKILRRVK